MLVQKTDILNFIPQRPPMVMVDELLSNTKLKCTSQFQIHFDNIFCSGGYFTEPGLIENIAQTAALKAGFEASKYDEKVKVGFIGAVKQLMIHDLPKINDVITTTITVINNFGNIQLVKGEGYGNGNLLAKCELSIFTQEENTENES